MSEKRRSAGTPGPLPGKKIKAAAEQPAATAVRVREAAQSPRPSEGRPSGAAPAAKLKARLKAKKSEAPAPQRGAAAAAKKQPRAPAEAPVPRPRLRRASPTKRAAKTKSSTVSSARFAVGDVVKHKIYPFRGVIFDIDPVFANTEEWWLSIPEQMRPKKNQPFYHLLAENAETEYIAYVSEQNLLPDTTGVPVRHPQISDYFIEEEDGKYRPVFMSMLN